MPRLALIGLGKMGRALRDAAAERGWPVVLAVAGDANRDARALTPDALEGVEAAIEFTAAHAAAANVRACIRAGCPVVSGTTGWDDERARVEAEVRRDGGAFLWSPNFAPGVHVFWAVAQQAARLAARAGFDAHIIETHHAAKRDAPSGTARQLRTLASSAFGREIEVTSIRVGSVPGTHELLLDAPFEQIRITHVARDRRVFADGALLAARWLVGRRGVFTMADLLASDTGTAS